MTSKEQFITEFKAAKWASGGTALFLRTNEIDFTKQLLTTTVSQRWKTDVYHWSREQGIVNPHGNRIVPNTRSFYDALRYAQTIKDNSCVVFNNSGYEISAAIKSQDKLILNTLKALIINTLSSSFMFPFFTGPIYEIPSELAEYFQVLDVPLPDYAELNELLTAISNVTRDPKHGFDLTLTEELKRNMINAALGLTRREARIAFNHAQYSRSFTDDDVNTIAKIKSQKYSNKALEFHNNVLNLDDVGGLENLKQWLTKRKPLWTTDENVTHIPKPKGLLLTGLPGTGKSLSAKAIASAFGFPLLRLDIGSVFGKYYGESEAGMRTALKTAEANAPCVLWIDEIEKGLGANTDGAGAQTREAVIGTLLTWLQERKADVFVVATANNVTSLRPELLRKGRFDEIFFVDLPTDLERESIFRVHLKKLLPNFSGNMVALIKASIGFSGAEIEQAIISALIEVYDTGIEAKDEDIVEALVRTTPLSVSQKDTLTATRKWARDSNVVYAGVGIVELPRAGFSL